jgi:hypothetical protein
MATAGQLTEEVSKLLGLPKTLVGTKWRQMSEAGLTTKGGRGLSAPRMQSRDAAQLLAACCGASVERSSAVTTLEDYGILQSAHTARMLEERHTGRTFIVFEDETGNAQERREERHHWKSPGWSEDDLAQWHFDGMSLPSLEALSEHHSLIDLLTALIDAAQANEFGRLEHEKHPGEEVFFGFIMEFRGPVPGASIEIDLSIPNVISYREHGQYLMPETVAGHHLSIDGAPPKLPYEELEKRFNPGDMTVTRRITQETFYGLAELMRS